jgi:hypothetical protein
MYGLPADFDGAFFTGRVVEEVSFTTSSIVISFDQRVAITIESAFEHVVDAMPGQSQIVYVPVCESKLMALIGLPVRATEAKQDGTLTLFFDGGQILRCIDDKPNYESYIIRNGDNEIYV